MKNDAITGEENANTTHYNMGRDIRKFIEEQGGTVPEKLPTPKKSLKELEKENKNAFKFQKKLNDSFLLQNCKVSSISSVVYY